MSADREVVVRHHHHHHHHYGEHGDEVFAGTPAQVRAQLVARFGALRRRDCRGRDLMDLVKALDRCQAYAATIGLSDARSIMMHPK